MGHSMMVAAMRLPPGSPALLREAVPCLPLGPPAFRPLAKHPVWATAHSPGTRRPRLPSGSPPLLWLSCQTDLVPRLAGAQTPQPGLCEKDGFVE